MKVQLAPACISPFRELDFSKKSAKNSSFSWKINQFIYVFKNLKNMLCLISSENKGKKRIVFYFRKMLLVLHSDVRDVAKQ